MVGKFTPNPDTLAKEMFHKLAGTAILELRNITNVRLRQFINPVSLAMKFAAMRHMESKNIIHVKMLPSE